ncbi:hypothetical protein ACFQZ4_33645 [Catellatospora coxensis]
MTGLFASIGVDLAREDLRQLTMSVVTAGVAVPHSRRFCDHVWTDTSGARVVARPAGAASTTYNPHSPAARWRWPARTSA